MAAEFAQEFMKEEMECKTVEEMNKLEKEYVKAISTFNFTELLVKDNNTLVCRLGYNNKDQNRVILCTQADAWTKAITITGGSCIGNRIRCPDDGTRASGNLSHLKYVVQNVGPLSDKIHLDIQFEKAKTFGVMDNCGTNVFTVPTEKCTDIIIFWPDDSAGDWVNDLKQDLSQVAEIMGDVQKICDAVANIAKDGMEVAECFA